MEGEEDCLSRKITVGVCVMEKKAVSAPMLQILERLEAFGEFEIVYFGDKVILEEPIESWPICECLIAFHSSGYPLQRAEAYAALRKEREFVGESMVEKYIFVSETVEEYVSAVGEPWKETDSTQVLC